MPITRRDYESRPYVRPAYEPDTRTLLQLMQLAGASRANAAGQKGQLKAQGLMTLGQVLAQGLGNLRLEGERKALTEAAAAKQQREDAFKLRDQQLREADLLARVTDREQAATRQATLDAQKAGDTRAKAIGYGPMSEMDVDPVMQSPERAGDVRYVFGPGTAQGPELQPTPEQERGIQTQRSIEAMGGTIGPNGQVVMPPREPQAPNPTESSLAVLAAKGDPNALKALEILRRQRPAPASGPRPMTQTAESQLISRWSNQWTAAAKPIKDLERQVSLMDTGMEAVKRGDLAQGAQMVLVTFQKILDPPSVVRESEFMRSAAGQSLMNRVKGAVERITSGGAGVTADELQKFAQLAREAATAQRNASGLDKMRARLGRNADRYGIPHDLIFDEDAPAVDEKVEEWGFDEKGNLVRKGGG